MVTVLKQHRENFSFTLLLCEGIQNSGVDPNFIISMPNRELLII